MSEWGPWQLHDGRGCPCFGMIVQVECFDGFVDANQVGSVNSFEWLDNSYWSAWVWNLPRPDHIRRYRIRKPKGLQVLESILSEIDTPAKEVTS